jgi:hypothetical protein
MTTRAAFLLIAVAPILAGHVARAVNNRNLPIGGSELYLSLPWISPSSD